MCVWCVHICMYAPCDISRQVPFRTMLEFSMYSLKVKSVALCYLYMCDLGGRGGWVGWEKKFVCFFFLFFFLGGVKINFYWLPVMMHICFLLVWFRLEQF